MKIHDYAEVTAEICRQIEERDYTIVDWCGVAVTTLIVANIYMTNDFMRGFGQDYKDVEISVISSPTRIAVIWAGSHTFIKCEPSVCVYEDLSEDIESILMCIQACLDEIESREGVGVLARR